MKTATKIHTRRQGCVNVTNILPAVLFLIVATLVYDYYPTPPWLFVQPPSRTKSSTMLTNDPDVSMLRNASANNKSSPVIALFRTIIGHRIGKRPWFIVLEGRVLPRLRCANFAPLIGSLFLGRFRAGKRGLTAGNSARLSGTISLEAISIF